MDVKKVTVTFNYEHDYDPGGPLGRDVAEILAGGPALKTLCIGYSLTLADLIVRAKTRWPGCDLNNVHISGGIKDEFWFTHKASPEPYV
jgi:hypothetical protein